MALTDARIGLKCRESGGLKRRFAIGQSAVG